MRLCPLAKVMHLLKVGQPLPFGIRDAGGRLLLARGIVVGEPAQFEAMLERGAFVDLDDLQGPRADILKAPPERLPQLWRAYIERVGVLLHQPPTAAWLEGVKEQSRTLLTLVDRSPDLAIFLLVRRDAPERCHYGVQHAVHAAVCAVLVGQRLEWPEPRVLSLVRAALTMNLSIVDLQGRLAVQPQPPTALQRTQIRQHPEQSVAMLVSAGVNDAAWLDAVLQHHEAPGGTGYPQGLHQVDELGEALRVCDVYTAKFAPRASRRAMAGNQAARSLFTAYPQSPVTAAVVKEFGLYPPGSVVQLQSGELAVVVRRGASANTPQVDVLVGRNGEPTLAPVRKDTSHKGCGIAQMVGDERMPVRVAPEVHFAG